MGAWLDSLPRILAGADLRKVADAIVAARARKRAIIWGLGGHVIKCGLAPVLIDLMRRGYATVFAMNGAAAIHDFEIALAGHTSEDVEAALPDGRFGSAEETGREMNGAIAEGARDGLGIGEALGRRLESAGRSGLRAVQPGARRLTAPRRPSPCTWRWEPIRRTRIRPPMGRPSAPARTAIFACCVLMSRTSTMAACI